MTTRIYNAATDMIDRHLAEGWRLNRVDSILRAILRAGAFLSDGDAVEARRAAAPATSQPGRERVGSR